MEASVLELSFEAVTRVCISLHKLHYQILTILVLSKKEWSEHICR